MNARNLAIWLTVLGLMLLPAAGGVLAAEVSQGRCIAFDETNHLVTIEAYDLNFSKDFPYGQPTGVNEEFDVATAMIGIKPEPGDILRLAWNPKDGRKAALKVMNVSKQDLRKK